MKVLEWSSIVLVVVSYFLIATGHLKIGFSLALISCLSYGLWFALKHIWSGVGLQSFFLVANIIGLSRTLF